MRHINLLPWREEQRRSEQQHFLRQTLVVIGVAVLFVAAVEAQLQGMVSTQEGRNNYLRQQIGTIDNRLGTTRGTGGQGNGLAERMQTMEKLAAGRAVVVHLFDALPRTVPDGVMLEEVKQIGKSLEISGTAHSNAGVSSFLRQLDESPWFHSARLSVINVDNRGDSRFVLEVGTRQQGGSP